MAHSGGVDSRESSYLLGGIHATDEVIDHIRMPHALFY
jgi:hypothetical protein